MLTEAAKIALEEKRHKEIAGLLSEVKAAVMSKKDNAGLEQLFNKLTDKIQPPKMPDIPAPNVSVQVDNKAVSDEVSGIKNEISGLKDEIGKLKESMDNILNEISKRQQWEFVLNKNGYGITTSVIAQEK